VSSPPLKDGPLPRYCALETFVAEAPYAVAMFDRAMRFVAVNERFISDYRLNQRFASPGLVVGLELGEVTRETPDRWKAAIQRCLAGSTERAESDHFERADGSIDWVGWSMRPWSDEDGAIGGVVVSSVMLSPQVEAEDAANRYWSILEDLAETVCRYTASGAITLANDAFCRWLGVDLDELIGRNGWDYIHPEDRAMVRSKTASLTPDRPALDIENRVITSDGQVRWGAFTNRAFFDGSGRLIEVQTVGRDITRQKVVEESLRRATRALKTFSATNHAVVNAHGIEELLQDVCEAIVDVGGYRGAWIGRPLQDAGKTIRILASARDIEHVLAGMGLTWSEGPLGQGPASRAIRSGQVELMVAAEPPRAATRRRLWDAFGVGGCIALPLTDRSGLFGVLVVYTAEREAFDAEEIDLLTRMAGDLSHGLVFRQLSAERAATMHAAMRALAGGSEGRSHLTSRNERPVAQIAIAIAAELGLAEDQREAIRLAALLHDIGQAGLPPDLLNRPGPLSPAEFELVKTHARLGFEILQDIAFPWPVTQVALQHHERMDGSGYPHGLAGDDICLEARIVAVADVASAMTSERPHRSGLGLDAAIAEIERGSGAVYDARVADAFISVVRRDADVRALLGATRDDFNLARPK
jgi:PAS domain S-box-containing protein/putative nucleotidyltransferase with HDIG domain